MFVRKSVHRSVVQRLEFMSYAYDQLMQKHTEALERYSALKERVDLLQATGFTQAELKRLIGLIHPDKHGNKPSSVELTQKVLKMMGK